MSMNHFLKSLLVALLVTASASAVELRWSGAVSTDYMTAGNWTVGTTGVPSVNPPAAGDTISVYWPTSFTPTYLPNLSSAAPGIGTSAGGLFVGMNPYTTYSAGTLYILPGATVTLNSAYGYHRIPGNGAIYQTGGTVTCSGNSFMSYNATGMSSVYEITGGAFNFGNGKSFAFLNRRTDAQARLNVYGGSFTNTANWRVTDSTYYPAMDATWGVKVKNSGRFYWPWNKATTTGYITSTNQNLKSGDSTQGLVLSWNTANTYVTVTAKYAVATRLTPLEGQGVPPSTALPLTWIKPLCMAGTSMPVNVRYGEVTLDANGIMLDPGTSLEDPNGNSLPLVVTNQDITTTTVLAENEKNYCWRVETIDPGVPGDANYPAKTYWAPRAYLIKVGNQPPVVTIPTAATTAIGLRSGTVTWATTATATDDGLPNPPAARTFVWSQVSGPAVAGLPTASSSTGDVSLNITAANTYTFRCTASDSSLTGSADVTVTVYADRCAAAKARTGYTAAAGDINADCWVNIVDIALMVENWVKCNSLDPGEVACL